MRCIGLDLAWKMRPGPGERRTALVSLSEGARVLDYRRLGSDEDVAAALTEVCSSGCIVGVDAPLVVPPDTRGRRTCEASLMEMGIRVLPTDPVRFERWYGGCRGVVLLERLRELDAGFELVDRLPTHVSRPVAEVYPTGSWRRLFGDVPRFKGTDIATKRRSLMELIRRLEVGASPSHPGISLGRLVEAVGGGALGPSPPRAPPPATGGRGARAELSEPSRGVTNFVGTRRPSGRGGREGGGNRGITGGPGAGSREAALEAMGGAELDALGDALDAVMSAYTVLLWSRNPRLCEVVGNLERGFIVLPKSPGEPARRS
ncbi:MAG: DUF429 domain-containing protein [Thermoplasmatota archaeon]